MPSARRQVEGEGVCHDGNEELGEDWVSNHVLEDVGITIDERTLAGLVRSVRDGLDVVDDGSVGDLAIIPSNIAQGFPHYSLNLEVRRVSVKSSQDVGERDIHLNSVGELGEGSVAEGSVGRGSVARGSVAEGSVGEGSDPHDVKRCERGGSSGKAHEHISHRKG